MIEHLFDLATSPEVKRYELHNAFNDVVQIVTMDMIDKVFERDPVELLRIKNNNSAKWYIVEI